MTLTIDPQPEHGSHAIGTICIRCERDHSLSEEAERWAAEDAIEAEWRERYPDADELELRRLGGDR